MNTTIDFLIGRPDRFGISREKLVSYIPMMWGIARLLGMEAPAGASDAEAATWLGAFFVAADVAWNALSPFVVGIFMFMQRHLRRWR